MCDRLAEADLIRICVGDIKAGVELSLRQVLAMITSFCAGNPGTFWALNCQGLFSVTRLVCRQFGDTHVSDSLRCQAAALLQQLLEICVV